MDFHNPSTTLPATQTPPEEKIVLTMHNLLEAFSRIAANKQDIELMRKKMLVIEEAIEFRKTTVEYITSIEWVTEKVHQASPPALFRGFYALSLTLTLAFGALLFLNGMGLALVHPFISGVGFLGSIGWLTTAVTDLRDWRTRLARKDA